MKLIHEKSKCCAAKIIRFGGKRRQCTACRKTWRVHPAKPGRRTLRRSRNHLNKVFNHGFSVKQIALHSRLSIDAVYKRFNNELKAVVNARRIIRIRGQKLILIVDAEWQLFKNGFWTLYCLSVKSTNSETVTVFDPVLKSGKENATDWNVVINGLPLSVKSTNSETVTVFDPVLKSGKENATDWNVVINGLPLSVKNRLVAVVSDGIRGFDAIAYENGWIIQRCHFHLLSMLQKMRGKRASTPGRQIREKIYQSAKLAITEISKRRVNVLCRRLAILAKHPLCPRRMRMVVRELLRHFPEYRSYLQHPEFNLPTTVNVMESVNSYIRRKARTVNAPNAWRKWAIAAIRFKSKFTCK